MQAETTTVDNTVDERVSTDMDTPDDDAETSTEEAEPAQEETFPRKVVEDLRQENGRYRQRAQKAEQRLHAELVRASGRLADPSDLAFDAGHLDNPSALTAAIDELLERKPHLAARKPIGDIGQGITKSTAPVDLAAILRQRAT